MDPVIIQHVNSENFYNNFIFPNSVRRQICAIKNLRPGLEVIKLELILRLKIKHNDWLLAYLCPCAANHCALF